MNPHEMRGSQDKVPAVPTGLTIQKNYDEAGILTWNPVPRVTEYKVYIRTNTSSNEEWHDQTTQTVTEPKYEYDLEDYMGSYSPYVYVEMRVSAANQKGESEKSEPVTDFYGY